MPARYVILKKTRNQAVVKVIGTGVVDIPLSDFKLVDETLTAPNADINFLYWNVPPVTGAYIEVKRGTNTIHYLTGGDNWSLSQGTGFVDNEYSDQSLRVEIIGGNSTIIICLTKNGYTEPDTQAWNLDRNTLP